MAEIRVKGTGTIKLFESDNTSSVTIASPASLSANKTITLPDADVTLVSGTMLATDGSGASLTALNASELGSGTVPTARLGSGTASSSTVLYGDQTYKTEPSGGITESDCWRNTASTNISAGSAYITSNWERDDSYGFGLLGTGLSESSGIFSFPSTGYWMVQFSFLGNNDNGSNSLRFFRAQLSVTTDNASYNIVTRSTDANQWTTASTGLNANYCFKMLDVTDIANIKFQVGYNVDADCAYNGSTDINYTYITAWKLGDT